MSVRSCMTMRARVLRDTQTREDDYGHKGPPTPEVIGGVAGVISCRVWYSAGYLAIRDTSTVSARDLKMIVPLSADIRVGDVVDKVWDRRGRELFSNLKVEAPMRRSNHVECRLQQNA